MRSRLVAAVCLAIVAAGNAQATVSTTTFTGTFVAGTVDTYGFLSGTAGTALGGMTFSETITFDLSGETTIGPGAGTYSYNWGPFTLNQSVTLTGGSTVSYGSGVQVTETVASGTSGPANLQFNSDGTTGKLVTSIYTSTNFSPQQFMTLTGLDNYMAGTVGYSSVNVLDVSGGSTHEQLNFTISQVGVPEPASFALVAGGFAALGIVRRRRTRN